MAIQIIECDQGSPEWFSARLGIPTASEFKTLIGVKKDAREKLTRQSYMRKLAGEIITGQPMESYTNVYMERGKDLEDEARTEYAFAADVEPQRVGFLRDGNKGCSPDSLVGTDGGLEIKIALPHIQIERLEDDVVPSEHKFQVHGNIWISNRAWWDFASYCPGLPLFTKRVYRDDKIIADLNVAVELFNDELAAMVMRIRNYGQKAKAA
jgi:hypothetical protein